MKSKVFLLALSILLAGGLSAQTLGGALKKLKDKVGGGESLTQEEVGRGLKEALNVGVTEAVDFLSTEDGYYQSVYKILLPEEAEKVINKLRAVPGFDGAEQELILRLNRAAETAAAKAKPIFVEAITGMTFQDAFNILRGEPDAATRYLERTTHDQLYAEFHPVVVEALDAVNAREYWRTLTSAYNQIPFTKRIDTELDDYTTRKALEGLFGEVEEKEKDIRQNAGARTSDLLRKVFGDQK